MKKQAGFILGLETVSPVSVNGKRQDRCSSRLSGSPEQRLTGEQSGNLIWGTS